MTTKIGSDVADKRVDQRVEYFDKCTTSTTTTKIGTDVVDQRKLFSYILDISRMNYQTTLAKNCLIIPC